MLKRLFKMVFIVLLPIVLMAAVAIAQEGDDGQSNDRPPGWDKGKKEGWQSDVPPGQEEKEKKGKKITGGDEDSDNEKLKKEKKEKKAKKSKK